MRYRILRNWRKKHMPAIANIRKAKKEPTPASIEASREINNDKVIMSKIKQSYREAKLGQTVSLRDLIK